MRKSWGFRWTCALSPPTPLKRIPVAGGDVLHALKATDSGFRGFGEAYFSVIEATAVEAWKMHRRMTLNLVEPLGEVRFIFLGEESRTLVIGRSGFIGSHVCRIAQARGYAVTALSLREVTDPVEGVRYWAANLADRKRIGAELAGQPFEYILNCGGMSTIGPIWPVAGTSSRPHFGGLQNLLDRADRGLPAALRADRQQ